MAKKVKEEVLVYIPPEPNYYLYARKFTLLAPIPYSYKMPDLTLVKKHLCKKLNLKEPVKKQIKIEQTQLF
jgi:hypothetical protein